MKSYLKFLSRNKLYTVIEAVGLSVALAFVIILVSYAGMEYRVGTQQRLCKNLYAVGGGEYLGMTAATAKEFFPSIPEIKEYTRLGRYNTPKGIVVDDKYFDANALAVDPNFLRLFDYRLRGCSPERILTDTHQAIISESFAKKAFGTANPVGRSIKCDTLQLKVMGVVEDFGREDVFKPYDVLVSMKLKDAVLAPMDNFGEVIPIVRLSEGSNPDKVAQKLLDKYVNYWPKFYKRTNETNALMWGSSLVRWDKLYFSKITSWEMRSGNLSMVNILLVVAFVLLLSAIFNYINLTVAQISDRAKEMATRRLLGESVWGIMWRYLGESALFTFVCFLLGGLLAWAFVPLFNGMLSTNIALFSSAQIWLWLLLAYLFISFLSGLIPAIVVSRFNPIDVVKGTIRLRSKMWFSKMFIVAQNVISMTLVAMALTMMLQMRHLAQMPLGYQTKDLLTVFAYMGGSYDKVSLLANRLKALPEVEEAVPGRGTPMECGANGVHDDQGNCVGYVRMCSLDSTAMKLLGIKVKEQYSEPTNGKLWISEAAKRAWGVSAKKPWFGTKDQNGYEYEVCGVIADYHSGDALSTLMENEYEGIQVIGHDTYFYSILVKTRGDHAQALAAIHETCRQVDKELVGVPADLDAEYMDDTLKNALKDKHNMMLLIFTFMGISILISALGLFGMSVYYGRQQKKQIALRKVMGASVVDAAWHLARRYLVSSLVAVVIAIPLCVKLMQNYLLDFAYRIAFPWHVLIVGAIFTLLVAFVSVITCTLRTAMQNPVDSIKAE